MLLTILAEREKPRCEAGASRGLSLRGLQGHRAGGAHKRGGMSTASRFSITIKLQRFSKVKVWLI
jgi:hypothetical protein